MLAVCAEPPPTPDVEAVDAALAQAVANCAEHAEHAEHAKTRWHDWWTDPWVAREQTVEGEEEVAMARTQLLAVLPLLREGLPQPWPAVIVELCSCVAAAKALGLLIQPHVNDRDAFAIGAPVLAYDDEYRHWWVTRIVEVEDAPIGLSVPRYRMEHAALKRRDRSLLPQTHVLTVSEGGPGAVLRAAAAADRGDLVTSLLAVGVSVFSADSDANTPLVGRHGSDNATGLHQKVVCRLNTWKT